MASVTASVKFVSVAFYNRKNVNLPVCAHLCRVGFVAREGGITMAHLTMMDFFSEVDRF